MLSHHKKPPLFAAAAALFSELRWGDAGGAQNEWALSAPFVPVNAKIREN